MGTVDKEIQEKNALSQAQAIEKFTIALLSDQKIPIDTLREYCVLLGFPEVEVTDFFETCPDFDWEGKYMLLAQQIRILSIQKKFVHFSLKRAQMLWKCQRYNFTMPMTIINDIQNLIQQEKWFQDLNAYCGARISRGKLFKQSAIKIEAGKVSDFPLFPKVNDDKLKQIPGAPLHIMGVFIYAQKNKSAVYDRLHKIVNQLIKDRQAFTQLSNLRSIRPEIKAVGPTVTFFFKAGYLLEPEYIREKLDFYDRICDKPININVEVYTAMPFDNFGETLAAAKKTLVINQNFFIFFQKKNQQMDTLQQDSACQVFNIFTQQYMSPLDHQRLAFLESQAGKFQKQKEMMAYCSEYKKATLCPCCDIYYHYNLFKDVYHQDHCPYSFQGHHDRIYQECIENLPFKPCKQAHRGCQSVLCPSCDAIDICFICATYPKRFVCSGED